MPLPLGRVLEVNLPFTLTLTLTLTFAAGLAVEAVSDQQKWAFKQSPGSEPQPTPLGGLRGGCEAQRSGKALRPTLARALLAVAVWQVSADLLHSSKCVCLVCVCLVCVSRVLDAPGLDAPPSADITTLLAAHSALLNNCGNMRAQMPRRGGVSRDCGGGRAIPTTAVLI
jgi:hypothetical protein